MAQEKTVSAKEAAIAVLNKAAEVSKKAKLMKSAAIKEAIPEKTDAAYETKKQDAPNEERTESVPNPSEEKGVQRNGNPGPGANPTNYGEDYKGHLKLAQWMGRMAHKRSLKANKNGQ